MSILCSMVGASFGTVAAVVTILRSKNGIQAYGNAQIDTAQSKFGGASALFDGAGDGLLISNTAPFDFGTGDFTIEFWIRKTSYSGSDFFIIEGASDSAANIYWYYGASYGLYLYHAGAARITTDVGSFSANTWQHIALVRNNSVTRFYVDGTQRGSDYSDTTSYSFPNGVRIGDENGGNGRDFAGWLDEIRFSKVARYTANFLAPTMPFVNDDNTVLLVHCNGTDASTFFEDDNGATTIRTARTLTAQGNAQLSTAQEKFGQSSMLFDGTGDHFISSASDDFTFTGDFTVELWVRLASTGSIRVPIGNRSSGTGLGIWWVEVGTDQAAYSAWQNTAGTSYYPVMPGTLSTNTWTHLAVVRNGSTLRMYKDGVGGTTITSVTGTFGGNGAIYIGGIAASYNWDGYIDEVRISNVARYTFNFTAPTTTFENDANTVLLVHADGANASVTVTDDTSARSPRGIYALGNANVSTAQSKFGGTSLALDGSGDRLDIPFSTNLALTTTNWTVEYWIRITSHTGQYTNTVGMWDDTTGDGVAYYFSCNMYDTTRAMGVQYFYNGNNSGPVVFGGTLTTGTWQHHAFVKNGNTLTAYKDGVSQGTHDMTGRTISPSNNTNLSTLKIGGLVNGGYLNGYMDEVRISNSARYTAAFVAPTEPFVNDANTLLLVHADGTNASTVFRDDNGSLGRPKRMVNALGNAQVSTAQSKFGGTSLLLDGVNDYLQTDTGINIASSNVTIELWYRSPGKVQDYPVIICNYPDYTPNTNTWVLLDRHNDVSNTKFSFWVFNHNSFSAPLLASSTSVANNTWYHLAVVRNSNTWTLYVNGVSEATATFSGSLDGTATPRIGIGRGNAQATSAAGYIDELRISKTARYTANFTPSTTAFQDDANNVLLLHMDGVNGSNIFLDDSGGRSAVGLSAFGNAQISTAQSKFGGTSALFDDNGDYLLSKNVSAGNFSGDFTVECWIYTSDTEGEFLACQKYNTAQGWGLITRSNNRIIWTSTNDGTYAYALISSNNAYANNTWTHIAVCHTNSTGLTEMFANGVRVASATEQNPIIVDSAGSLLIGGNIYGISDGNYIDGPRYFNGYLDEIRFSNIVRYSGSTYTIPTAAFQNDINTQFLLHCDGTNGSTVFTDDNGIAPYTP